MNQSSVITEAQNHRKPGFRSCAFCRAPILAHFSPSLQLAASFPSQSIETIIFQVVKSRRDGMLIEERDEQ